MMVDPIKDKALAYQLTRIHEEIAALRKQNENQNIVFLGNEILPQKILSTTPFLVAQSGPSVGTPASRVRYWLTAYNPSPQPFDLVFATMFFGLGNLFTLDQAWIGRDKRWPEFSSDATNLLSNEIHTFQFNYKVPKDVESGNYHGNLLLWQDQAFDTGNLLDRSSFFIKIE